METPTCPKCGKPMKERTQKTTGKPFWGCSDYPNCKGIIPIQSSPTSPTPIPQSEPTKEEWNKIGKQKTLCVLAEACIKAGKDTDEANKWMEYIFGKDWKTWDDKEVKEDFRRMEDDNESPEEIPF